MFEECQLTPRQSYGVRVDLDFAADRIEADIPNFQLGPQCARRASQKCLQSGHQFGHGKRLEQIVVGAEI